MLMKTWSICCLDLLCRGEWRLTNLFSEQKTQLDIRSEMYSQCNALARGEDACLGFGLGLSQSISFSRITPRIGLINSIQLQRLDAEERLQSAS
jgi:hypothetical protein